MFADVTECERINSAEDSIKLGKLNVLSEWTKNWQMHFIIDECEILSLGRRDNKMNFRLYNTEIDKSSCERDLGVMVTRDINPKQHSIGVQ